MARIVPSLQLAKKRGLTLTLTLALSKADREFFRIPHSSRGTILCRFASQASLLGWLVGNKSLPDNENQSDGITETIDSNVFKSSQSNVLYKTMKSQLVGCDAHDYGV